MLPKKVFSGCLLIVMTLLVTVTCYFNSNEIIKPSATSSALIENGASHLISISTPLESQENNFSFFGEEKEEDDDETKKLLFSQIIIKLLFGYDPASVNRKTIFPDHFTLFSPFKSLMIGYSIFRL